MSKSILAVSLIFIFSVLFGLLIYLNKDKKPMDVPPKIEKNIDYKKVLRDAPQGEKFLYNGGLFIKAETVETIEPFGEQKQIKDFVAWEDEESGYIYTINETNSELYDKWVKKNLSPSVFSEEEIIKSIRNSTEAYFSDAESIEQEQEFYFDCKMKAYSKREISHETAESITEIIFSGIIYCPDDISSLSLKNFTSRLSKVRTTGASEELTTIFSEEVFHRKLIKDDLEIEEYMFKYGNYFINTYYLKKGKTKKYLILDKLYPIAEELVWNLSKESIFFVDWEYPAGGKVVLADFNSNNSENDIVIASKDKIYAFNANKDLLWTFDGIKESAIFISNNIDLNSDGFSNEIVIQTENRTYALNKNGRLLWEFYVGNYIDNSPPIPIDLDDTGYMDDLVFSKWKSVYILNSEGRLEWDFSDNKGNIGSILTADLDGDGKMNDLIVGQNQYNQYEKNQSFPSTIYAFNSDGTVRWKNELNEFSQNYIFDIIGIDINHDNCKNEIMVGGNGGIWTFDSEGNLLWNHGLIRRIKHLTAIDLNKDGYQDEVIVGVAGNTYAMNNKGSLIWQSSTWSNLIYNGISLIDLDYDGCANEVIMGAEKIYAMNSKGEKLWTYEEARRAESSMIVDLDGDGLKDEIISFGDRVYVLDSFGNLIFTFGKGNVIVADLDSDGVSNDIIVSFPSNTYVYKFDE
ncbi:MAG: hypothetical protein U9P70_00135 [Patescibacteria group bacterium]|nr:hypothetical protein [Patescibacteria group bacterium]